MSCPFQTNIDAFLTVPSLPFCHKTEMTKRQRPTRLLVPLWQLPIGIYVRFLPSEMIVNIIGDEYGSIKIISVFGFWPFWAFLGFWWRFWGIGSASELTITRLEGLSWL